MLGLNGARPGALGARSTSARGSAAEDQVFDHTQAGNRGGTDPAAGLTDTVHPGPHLRHCPGQLLICEFAVHPYPSVVPEFPGQRDRHRPPGQFVGHVGGLGSLSEGTGRLPH